MLCMTAHATSSHRDSLHVLRLNNPGTQPACCAQVLGHSKTILVLLGGWAFLGDPVSAKQLSGMALAVLGMVLYGVASSQCAPLSLPWDLGTYPKLCKP